MADLELRVTGVAVGGDGIAHDDGGRVVFVPGAIPGDTVRAAIVGERPRFARASLLEVVDAAPGRVAPPCPHVGEGCGGCGWQHVDHGTQLELKRAIVADALRRLGRLPDHPPVVDGPPLAPFGHRTTARGLLQGGRFAYRRSGSHDPVDADGCLTAHPRLRDLIDQASFGAGDEVLLRVGAVTGERIAVVDPTVGPGLDVPDDVTVVGRDDVRSGLDVAVHEEVAGRRWRISAGSFFQTRPDGAEALVEVVGAAVRPVLDGESGVLADLYSGVGLFAGALGGSAARVIAVEGDRSAVADARHNLADLPAEVEVEVVKADVARWRPSPADVVVADPSRAGLGAAAVERVDATAAGLVVLVACDPAAFGRDAGLLTSRGFVLRSATTVDLFPHTPHVEVVGVFDR